MKKIRKKVIVEAAIWLPVLILLIAGILFFRSNIQELSSKVEEERKSLAEVISRLEFYANMKREYETEVAGHLASLKEKIPSQSQIINLPREIQFLASQAGAGVTTSFAEEAPPTSQQLGFVGIRINTTGSFEDIAELVRLIKRSFPLSVIDSVSMESDNENYTSVIRIRVFFRE